MRYPPPRLACLLAIIACFLFYAPYDASAQDLSSCYGLSQARPYANTPSAWDYCACAIDNSYCLSYGVPDDIHPPRKAKTPQEICQAKNNRIWTSEGCMTCWALSRRVAGYAGLLTSLVPALRPGAGSVTSFSSLAVLVWCRLFN